MTDQIERECKAFETWARGAGYDVRPSIVDGRYASEITQHAYRGWLARAQTERGVSVEKLDALAAAIERGGDAIRHLGRMGEIAAGTRSDVAASIRRLIPQPSKENGE